MKAKERALHLAARKLYSSAELRKKLIAEGYAEDDVDLALARLVEVHLLNDAALARSIAERYRDRGNRFVAQKLRQRGISTDDAIEPIDELPAEFERALGAAEKKMRSLVKFEPRVQSQKLYQHLAARGFSGETIGRVCRQLVRPGDDDL